MNILIFEGSLYPVTTNCTANKVKFCKLSNFQLLRLYGQSYTNPHIIMNWVKTQGHRHKSPIIIFKNSEHYSPQQAYITYYITNNLFLLIILLSSFSTNSHCRYEQNNHSGYHRYTGSTTYLVQSYTKLFVTKFGKW